jgi:alkanesulfonate monooxygenase SsuD/methylene tetrahydromethanopterin reductase-like flavin-dependent oxidoreductase (luciferase family)
MNDYKIGINLWSQTGTWQQLLEAAQEVDRLGYSELWTWDHVKAIFGDPHQPIMEGWTTITAWAMATRHVKVGLMVGANTFRNPGLVAKIVTTLDHISGGRAILGIGGAWFELEHREFGIEFGTSFGQRLDWLDESVARFRALVSGEFVTSPAGGTTLRRRHDQSAAGPEAAPDHDRRQRPDQDPADRREVRRHLERFRPAGEVREHDTVLRKHCESVGRDQRRDRAVQQPLVRGPRLGGGSPARVGEMDGAEPHATRAQPRAGSRPVFGTPETIAERASSTCDVGFTTALVEMPAPYDRETLTRLATEVKPLVVKG